MKPLSYALIGVMLAFGVIAYKLDQSKVTTERDAAAAKVTAEREVAASKFLLDLKEREITVLREQIDDMEFMLSSKGSYEDGYAAALIRTGDKGGSYIDGFADAKKKYEAQDYVTGYHNAIKQFGDMWEPPVNVNGKPGEKKPDEKPTPASAAKVSSTP